MWFMLLFFFFFLFNSRLKLKKMLLTFGNASFLLKRNITMWTDQCLFMLFSSAMQLVYVLTGYQT